MIKKTPLHSNYFKTKKSLLVERIKKANTKSWPIGNVVGLFNNQSHYLQSVDLLRNSSLEAEHQYEVFKDKVLPKIKKYNKLLDIGIGNGEVSKFFGLHFQNITAIDTSSESLDLLPTYHWTFNSTITKIEGDILAAIPSLHKNNEKYDLILLSHVLYYIPSFLRPQLVNNLAMLLEPYGKLVITYNDGNDRSFITDYFGGKGFSFSLFENYVNKRFTNGEHITFQEKMCALTAETMLHILGVCLYDANTHVETEKLQELLRNFHTTNNEYEVSMTTHVLILGNSNDLENNN
jgi:SAM-dependent methyltransferase